MIPLGKPLNRLAGKIACVTGGGSDPTEGVGTGAAISRLFAHEGANVVILDLDEERAQNTAKQIYEESGDRCVVVPADVTSEPTCNSAAQIMADRFGKIDILVNNLGISTRTFGGVADTLASDWDRIMNVNLRSSYLMSRSVIPFMIAQGSGSIIFISSVAAERGNGACAYSASKLAMTALARDTTAAYGSNGIRANVVEPGTINTPIYDRLLPHMSAQERAAHYSARAQAVPLGIEGTAWDIAYASLFLASDEARWISGATLPVDGGLLARGSLVTRAFTQTGSADR